MRNEEAKKILKKIEIVLDWFDENVDREYGISITRAQELIEKLEEIK